jgi:hypothetical protein
VKLEEKCAANKRFSYSPSKPTNPAATATVNPSEVEGSRGETSKVSHAEQKTVLPLNTLKTAKIEQSAAT